MSSRDGIGALYFFNDCGFPLEIKVTAGSTSFKDLVYREKATGQISREPNSGERRHGDLVYDWGTLQYTIFRSRNSSSQKRRHTQSTTPTTQ